MTAKGTTRYLKYAGLLGGLLLLIGLWRACAPTQPSGTTGDPLYDRLQEAMLDKAQARPDRENLLRSAMWRWGPAQEQVQSWEPQFAERSDYWCLRMICGETEDAGQSRQALLERAVDCGDATQAPAAQLMQRELFEIRYDESRQLDAEAEDTATAEVIERYRRLYPDSAWVCYLAADHLSYYGMTAQYVEMLELGNSLHTVDPGELFPASVVINGLENGNFSGDPVLAGSILQMRGYGVSLGLNGMIRIRDQYKEMQLAGTELGTSRGLTALMRRELRSWGANPLPLLIMTEPSTLSVAHELLHANADWEPGSLEEQGAAAWLADCAAYLVYTGGLSARLQQQEPQLAKLMWSTPDGNLHVGYGEDQGLLSNTFELLRNGLTGEHSLRRMARAEYRYSGWLMQSEVPEYRRRLEHLATFDFEHPELYVGMEPVAK
jgi:hypothetical protein